MMVVEEQENEICIYIDQIINDYNLYIQGKNLLTLLNPLSKGLNILQKDFVTVTNSVWMTLLKEETL